MLSSAYYMSLYADICPWKVRFPWNQAITWYHFPIEQPIVMNSVYLKRESAGTPIVVASKDFRLYGVFESN